ncbi:MAG: hypothetical protein RMK89_13885, partial [Armatimonadota bacterium]|nr:hypothetical protein [Armatimonadota bacterium]MDW8144536.1 hypothetical protein [Armatimonadota bacterium]
YKSDSAILIEYFREEWGIKEGERIQFPFPTRGKTFILGKPPPFGQGVPILFLNISWIAYPEVWETTIQEILKKPSLYLVLLYRLKTVPEMRELQEETKRELELLRKMLGKIPSSRVSAIASEQFSLAFGTEIGGILAILCDGQGIVRAVEFYPSLKRSPRWSEEVADWRPKLHQAVKKVLDEFFQRGQGR